MTMNENDKLKHTIGFQQITEIMLMFREQAFEDGIAEMLQYDNDIIVRILERANPNVLTILRP